MPTLKRYIPILCLSLLSCAAPSQPATPTSNTVVPKGFKDYCVSQGATNIWWQPSCSNQAIAYCSKYDTGSASCNNSWWCGSDAQPYVANAGTCLDPYQTVNFCLHLQDDGYCDIDL